MLSGESGYIVLPYAGTANALGEKMERTMRSFVERESMRTGVLKRIDAVIMGDTLEFLLELLNSDGGLKGNLFQVDDIYENYYYVPTIEQAKIQALLLADRENKSDCISFYVGYWKNREIQEYQVSVGVDQARNPVYFCYELEMRHLLRVKQELGMEKSKVRFSALSYQKRIRNLFWKGGCIS